MTVLEFWPDYGSGPLWAYDGKPVDLASIGLGRDIIEAVEAWNAEYSETKIPVEGPGDVAWLRQGKRLLGQLRDALGDQYEVVVTEPWWGEPPV